VDFVGHVVKPWHRTMRRRTLRSALQRIESMPAADLFDAANSYFGLLRQSPSSHHNRADLANAMRKRGFTVKGDLTKVYRRTHV